MKLTERLENLFAAVAFAEEGEIETARELMGSDDSHGGHDTVCVGSDCTPVRA